VQPSLRDERRVGALSPRSGCRFHPRFPAAMPGCPEVDALVSWRRRRGRLPPLL